MTKTMKKDEKSGQTWSNYIAGERYKEYARMGHEKLNYLYDMWQNRSNKCWNQLKRKYYTNRTIHQMLIQQITTSLRSMAIWSFYPEQRFQYDKNISIDFLIVYQTLRHFILMGFINYRKMGKCLLLLMGWYLLSIFF